MSTLQIVSNAKLTAGELDLSSLSIVADIDMNVRAGEVLRVARDGRSLEIDLPAGVDVQIRVNGFTDGANRYSITATSRFESDPEVTWTIDGNAAVSPVFTAEGNYVLDVTATPDTTNVVPRRTTVSAKIRRPGKPDDFLANRFPA
jgi:hypothetical protein